MEGTWPSGNPYSSAMASSPLPLAPSSYQVWKKTYLRHDSGAGSSTMGAAKNFVLPAEGDDNNISPAARTVADGVGESSAENGGFKTRGWTRSLDPNMDPRKLRRIVSNRISAQKSRMKKMQYVADMEMKVKALEAQIAVLSPQVAHYTEHYKLLQMERRRLNQKMAAFDNERLLIDAEIEKKKAEVKRLRQLQFNQEQEMMRKSRFMTVWDQEFIGQMMDQGSNLSAFGQSNVNSNQVQIGENTAEMNRMMRQQNLMPVWEAGSGQMMDLNLNQSEAGLELGSSLNQFGLEQNTSPNSSLLGLGEIEKLLNQNPRFTEFNITY
ncbi:hypothetical protein SLE2022_286270 [Rubroshorea leprosula]